MPRTKSSAVMTEPQAPATGKSKHAPKNSNTAKSREVLKGQRRELRYMDLTNGERRAYYTWDSLNPMQKAFIEEYAKGETVMSASKRAGYATPTAVYELMKVNSSFIALAQAARQRVEEKTLMSRARVVQGLLEAADMAKLLAEPASMVAAWREIGKMHGYYAPIEHRVTVGTNATLDKMNKLTDAELLELVRPAQEQLKLEKNAHVVDVEPRSPAVDVQEPGTGGEDAQAAQS